MTGCVERLVIDPSLIEQQPTTGFDTETDTSPTDGTDPSNPSDPSDPTTTPTDPTTDPTDPTTDPTDPTTDPTDPTQGNVNGPPQLVDVRLIDPSTLELQFNEAMGAPGEVDVSAFRLSVGFANYYSGKYGYGGTYYQYLQAFTGEETCYENCYCDYYDDYCEDEYCYENCYTQPGPPVDFVSLSQVPGTQHRWLARVSTPIDGVCGPVREIQDSWDEGGMFLHYSNNSFPGVVDAQGEALAPLAEHWVLAPGQNFVSRSGYFEAMDPFIPIDCPF